jgi:hypothetical protein
MMCLLEVEPNRLGITAGTARSGTPQEIVRSDVMRNASLFGDTLPLTTDETKERRGCG